MKMIQDPKIKIYKKICSKLPLIPSYNGFHDVEVHGKIHAVYSGNDLSWWGSEIQKDEQFSSRKFNKILKERFLKKDVLTRAKLLGMDVDYWNVKIVKIKWV